MQWAESERMKERTHESRKKTIGFHKALATNENWQSFSRVRTIYEGM